MLDSLSVSPHINSSILARAINLKLQMVKTGYRASITPECLATLSQENTVQKMTDITLLHYKIKID